MTRPVMVMLDPTVTIPDLARALQFSGLSLSSTHQPNFFVVRLTPRTPAPVGVVSHLPPSTTYRETARADSLRADREEKS